jgi:hypothetical protein
VIAFASDVTTRWRSYWHYYGINVFLLLFPYPLCCDWSMASGMRTH